MCIHGFDWWEEALDMNIPIDEWERLKSEKAKAIELDETRQTPVTTEFGGMTFQLLPTGAKGGREFVLVNETFRIELSSPKRGWAIKWRALSAALWEQGVPDLRDLMYYTLSEAGCTPADDDYQRLTRVDYCFDIHSPAFTREMFPAIASQAVCPSKTKMRGDFVIQEDRVETLTIGMGSTCQVQIYDKTKEITEASNKTWLYDLWAADRDTGEIHEPIEWSDVWRVEVRLKKDWLKNRVINRPGAFLEHMWTAIADGLYNRRLTLPSVDSNRRRWPLHPLFVMVMDEINNPREFLAIDKRAMGRAEELNKQIMKNISGSARSLVMLRLRNRGGFDEEEAKSILWDAFELMLKDPEHQEKIRRAVERYSLVDKPR